MLARAKITDLEEIVRIHRDVLPDTLNVKVGPKFLFSLYRVLLEDQKSVVWVYKERTKIIAFASISEDLKNINAKIISNIGLSNIIRVFFYFIFHPKDIKELLSRRKFSSYLENRFGNPYPIILTIGVDPKTQSKGIGSKLISNITKYFSSKGIFTFYVDTVTTNKGAISFYKKNGFIDQGNFDNNNILKFRR